MGAVRGEADAHGSNSGKAKGTMMGMQRGALAMIDILGFKGIWEKVPVDQLLESLTGMRRMLEKHAEEESATMGQKLGGPGKLTFAPRITVRMLSDTVVIALGVDWAHVTRDLPDPVRPQLLMGFLVSACGVTVAHTMKRAAIAPPHLAFRGAIASGEFLMEGNFLVGPAVDAAAGMMDEANAAVVVLADPDTSAAQTASPVVPRTGTPLFLDVVVPMKNDTHPVMRIINPYAMCGCPEERHDVLDGVRRSFARSDDENVNRKRDNTLKLFSFAAHNGLGEYP